VRPSGTEPKVKLYVNCMARERGEAERLLPLISGDARRMLTDAIG
jgi:phosphomannomutase